MSATANHEYTHWSFKNNKRSKVWFWFVVVWDLPLPCFSLEVAISAQDRSGTPFPWLIAPPLLRCWTTSPIIPSPPGHAGKCSSIYQVHIEVWEVDLQASSSAFGPCGFGLRNISGKRWAQCIFKTAWSLLCFCFKMTTNIISGPLAMINRHPMAEYPFWKCWLFPQR